MEQNRECVALPGVDRRTAARHTGGRSEGKKRWPKEKYAAAREAQKGSKRGGKSTLKGYTTQKRKCVSQKGFWITLFTMSRGVEIVAEMSHYFAPWQKHTVSVNGTFNKVPAETSAIHLVAKSVEILLRERYKEGPFALLFPPPNATQSIYTQLDMGATQYYAVEPSFSHSLARASTTPREKPKDPEAYRERNQLNPAFHHKLNAAWEDKVAPKKVSACLDKMGVKWSSIDIVRIGEAGISSGPVVLWIGVNPKSLSIEDANAAVFACLDVLQEFDITDVDVEIRETIRWPDYSGLNHPSSS